MFQFGRFPSYTYVFSIWYTVLHRMCFHIQKSADRGLFAAPRSLSQLVTSFFGSWCQGILLVLLFAWTSFASVYTLIYTSVASFSLQELLSTFKQFLVSYLAIFHNYLCLILAKLYLLPLISNFTWKDQIDFNLCLLPCSLSILSNQQLTFSVFRVLINLFSLFGFQWTFSKLNYSLSF